MRHRWTIAFLTSIAFVALRPQPGLGASSAHATEYEVKAAFLYSFAKYVQWPGAVLPNGDSPFVIGVLGPDPFEGVLAETLREKSVLGHPVQVARFARLEDALRSHILFVAGGDTEEQTRVLKALHGKPILSAGETKGFAERGGVVGFRTEDNRVRFDINLRSAEQAGLKISSQLLKLATIVEPRP